MIKERIMLIAGCSHAAGAEIDGTIDSVYNRENSFGNILAGRTKSRAVNIASSGSTNATIARTIIEWFDTEYDSRTMQVYVVISWTESSRMEVPVETEIDYTQIDTDADWKTTTSNKFLRINQGWQGHTAYEKKTIPYYQKFIVNNLIYLEIASANLVLQMQYFLKSKKVDYLMCNAMHMFSSFDHADFYISQIDQNNYLHCMDNSESFYWKYTNAGYSNPKAKYWHHDETPHVLYAKELYRFMKQQSNSF